VACLEWRALKIVLACQDRRKTAKFSLLCFALGTPFSHGGEQRFARKPPKAVAESLSFSNRQPCGRRQARLI
jgi:hypothetical protein